MTDIHDLDIPASLKREPKTTANAVKSTPPTNGAKPVSAATSKSAPVAAKPKASSAKKAPPADKDDANVVTLKSLCAELKVDPTAARVRLRAAVKHAAKSAWEWPRGSAALKDVRAILKG